MDGKRKMFCKNCGSEFADGEAFCPNCGTASDNVQSQPANDAQPNAAAPKSNSTAAIIAVAAVAVIIVIALITLLSGGAKKQVKKYFNAFGKFNTEKLLNMELPKDVMKESIEDDDYFDIDYEDFVEIYAEAGDTLYEGLKDEGKVKFEYEIKKMEDLDDLDKLDDDVIFDDLDELKDEFDDLYDDYDFDADKIKKAYAVEVKWTFTVDKDKVAKDTSICYVYKYKGDWYVYDGPTFLNVLYQLDEDDFEDAMEDAMDVFEELYD